MKRNIILGVLLLLAVCVGSMLMRPVSAQEEISGDDATETLRPDALVLTEDFTYSAGQLTDSTGGANVSGGNWVTNTGSGSFIPVTAGSLSYAGYPGSGVGNKIVLTATTASAEDSYRSFATQTSGTTYAAFMVNVVDTSLLPDNASTTGEYFAGFISSTSTTALVNRVTIRQGTAANTFQMGFRATGNAGNVQTFSNTDLPVGTTILVVISYQLVDGAANDVTSMWVNPTLGGTQPAPTFTQVSAADNADIGRIFVRQGSGSGFSTPNAQVDGIRVGTTWADVAGGSTPAPAPRRLFTTRLNGANEFPSNASTGKGYGRVVLNAAETQITASFYWEGLSSGTTAGHIHGNAAAGANAGILFNMNPTTGLTSGSTIDKVFDVTPQQVADLRAGLWYFNIHTTNFGGGEIRGQIVTTLPDAPYDLNGDGKTDFGVVRQTQNFQKLRWFNLTNTTPAVETQFDFGNGSDNVVLGDFDGDGKDDPTVWRGDSESSYYILQSSNNTMRVVRFGQPGDNPYMVADYDGDGVDDPAVYRPGATNSAQSTFWWYGSFGTLKNVQVPVNWGIGSDTPAPGDYTGDGKADFVLLRTVSNRNIWLIHPGTGGVDASNPNDYTVRFGLPTDGVVPGDYDGDGTTDIAVIRYEAGNTFWYYLASSSGVASKRRTHWGRNGDTEAQGDYDGDGKTDQAVWRAPATGSATFLVLRSSDGAPQYVNWGVAGDYVAAFDGHN